MKKLTTISSILFFTLSIGAQTLSKNEASKLIEKALTCLKKGDTVGVYDIFKCTWNDDTQTWSAPVNLGSPINSPYEDIYSNNTSQLCCGVIHYVE